MLGLWAPNADTFLIVLVITTTLIFALPIFLVPLRWARLFQWRLPAETDLAVYFGRCLGAFILVVEALMLRAGLSGEGMVFAFQTLLMVAVSMVIVHIWGALQRIQPWTETLEIGMYTGLATLALLFYPAG